MICELPIRAARLLLFLLGNFVRLLWFGLVWVGFDGLDWAFPKRMHACVHVC